jgi:hypothetical protein
MEAPFVVPETGLLINDFIEPWTKAFTINSLGIPVAAPESRLFQKGVSGREQEAMANAGTTAMRRMRIPLVLEEIEGIKR